MIDQLVSQLDSPDAERRKKAVIALGKSGDRSALAHLSRVYKTDPNPEIRELALKAGRFLKRETEGQQESVSLMQTEDAPTSMYNERAETAPVSFLPKDDEEVSEKDVARAKELLEQALDWHVRGKDDRAKDYLKKALATNPKLRRDGYTSSLAATITGMSGDEAIASLASEISVRKEKPKYDERKSKEGGGDDVKEVGWGDAIIDLMLYALVWAGGLTAIILLASEGLRFIANAMALSGGLPSSVSSADVEQLIATLPQIRVALIIGAIIFGLARAFLVFIQSFVIHFSAVSIMGGDGNLTTLIHGIVPTYIAADVISLVLTVGFFIYAGTTAATGTPAQARSMSSLWTNINEIYNFAILLWVGFLIGKVYRYGMFKGCLAEFISYILLIVLAVGFFCCLISIGGSLTASLIGTPVGR